MYPHHYGIIFSGLLPENKSSSCLRFNIIESVAILGCGWLGFPLAEYLIAKNYSVSGSTTTPEKLKILSQAGINPFHIEFKPEFIGSDPARFFNNDILIINIPPSLRKNPAGFHIAQVEEIKHLIIKSAVKKIIYISSTSVYPEINEKINEDYQFSEPFPELIQTENLFKNIKDVSLTILRCGGLMGYDRIPAKYFVGKVNIPEGDKPVNYVHRDDVIEIIYKIIEHKIWGETFNLVAPLHPTKKEVCDKTASYFNLPKPEFKVNSPVNFKVVEVEKLLKELNYQFIYPDPLHFYYQPKH